MSKYLKKSLNVEEAEQLYLACENIQEQLIVCTLLDTGLTVSELCKLKAADVQWQEKILYLNDDKKNNLTKRIVPVSSRVLSLLEMYFKNNDSWPVGIRRVQKIVKQVGAKAKLSCPITPRLLRRTFANFAIKKGTSLNKLQKILNHESIATTASYIDIDVL